jgi:hypothetical protein
MSRKNPFTDMEALRLRNKTLLADPLGNVVPLKDRGRAPPRKSASRERPWGMAYLDELATLRVPPTARLLYVLRYRSFRGRKKLVLDAGIAEQAGIASRHRSHYARKLEEAGLLRVECEGRRTLVVEVL